MKARTLGRHMKEGLKNLGRNGWMTFASISAVTVTLLLVGTFLIFLSIFNSTADSVEQDVTLQVLIDLEATTEQMEVLENNIRELSRVGSVEYSSKEEELDRFIEDLGEQGKAYAGMKQRGENPLNDVFYVKPNVPRDINLVQQSIDEMDHVFETHYRESTVNRLFTFMEYARYTGIALTIGLLFTAMFLISNTIKITIISRRKEIEIMKLVGATNAFIRWPFFLEGLFLGVLGALVPILALGTGYYYLVGILIDQSIIVLPELTSLISSLTLILIGLGVVIGVWGSLVSVRKFLKV
ncbi:permease-like cell division protein FtsX [Aureibacillus halotolerans]|uniref:Cell division protein FtsX n=1 Tax=Aureibacillus halotolerans TaxID=1508390 RepID=A0A4R6TY47_9BACI|nr:permease-like cell division protein FtsX [Aureibacillus halotolerans]TDQ36949.1 cell division protein FtsX [Aureibacillus halotolerans]